MAHRATEWEGRSKSRLLGEDPESSFVHIKVEVSLGHSRGAAGRVISIEA